jgi:adenylate cyclase, class 2
MLSHGYRLRFMQQMETEVKVRLHDREGFEHRLSELGFQCITARTFERNALYDTPERKLRNARQILRIREYGGKWVVTYKRIPDDDSPGERHKRRMEIETAVEDGAAMGAVFESVGFSPVFIYEKWRTEWADGKGHCVLDETPLGVYAELEGPSEWIDSLAERLKIDEEQFIKLSYGRLFESWRDETNSKVQHMTFAEIPQSFRQR